MSSGSSNSGAIISLIGGPEGYGVRRAWLGVLSGLEEAGRRIHVIAIAEGPLVEELKLRGIGVSVLGPKQVAPIKGGFGKIVSVVRRALLQLSVASRATKKVAEVGAVAVAVQNPMEVFMAGWIARRAGIKAFWLMPNSVADNYPMDVNRRLYRLAFRHLNVVPIGNSHHTIGTLGDPEKARHVAHLGVDLKEFDHIKTDGICRRTLGIPEHAAVLGIFARIVEEKGQLRFLEALSDLGPEGADVHVILCGGPTSTPYARRLADFIAAAGLSGRVHMLGPVDNPQPYYLISDVVVNSRIDPEPFGLSVVEAMVMGKPVYAHAAGGPGETVIDGSTGWLIAEPSRQAFSDGLRRVLSDRSKWPQMGILAREHGRANFSSAAMVDRLLAIIDREVAR